MIEQIVCPILSAAFKAIGVPEAVGCAVAKMIPKLVELGKSIQEKGGDPEKELDAVLDGVEAFALLRAEKGFQ